MKKIITNIIFISFLYPNGWECPFQGIRGLGMGNAYTAICEDASGIYWNPGGICFQKNLFEIQICGTYYNPMYEMKWERWLEDTIIEIEKRSKFDVILPQFFLSYKLNRLAIGFGHYFEYLSGFKFLDRYSFIGIKAFTPSISYRIKSKIGVGTKMEILYGKYENKDKWEEESEEIQFKNYGRGWSFTWGIGLLYKPMDILSIGVNLKGPFKFKSKEVKEIYTISSSDTTFEKYNIEGKCNFPIRVSFGIGFKPISNFVIGIDFEYSTWSSLDYFIKVREYEGGKRY